MLARITDRIRFWRDHCWLPRRASDYLDDEFDDGGARARHHLGECSDCRSLVDGLREIVDTLGSIGTEPSEPVASTVFASLQGQLVAVPDDTA